MTAQGQPGRAAALSAATVNIAPSKVVIQAMARHLAWILGAVILCPAGPVLAVPAHDGGPELSDSATPQDSKDDQHGRSSGRDDHRPWKFWEGESRAELGLSSQQAADIEQIFQATLPRLRAAKDRIDTLEKTLSKTINDNTADLATVGQQVDRLEAARADLYKTRTLMLYRMRGVLSAEQRTKLQALWEAGRVKGQGPTRR